MGSIKIANAMGHGAEIRCNLDTKALKHASNLEPLRLPPEPEVDTGGLGPDSAILAIVALEIDATDPNPKHHCPLTARRIAPLARLRRRLPEDDDVYHPRKRRLRR